MTHRAAREGTFVVRDGAVAYASDGLAALVGRPPAELVGRPALDLLVPEDRPRASGIRQRHAAGEGVPRALELSLLLADGTPLAVECHVERNGGEDVYHVRELGPELERRRLLDGLAAAGAAIRTERSEEGVDARVRVELERLGFSPAMLRVVAGRSQIVWVSVPEPLRREFTERAGARPEGFSGPTSAFARQVISEGAAFTDDWAAFAAGYMPPGLAADARALVQRAGFSRSIGVRIDAPGEGCRYLVLASPLLRSEDVPAVRLFGAQVSAALDAARTIADLSRRNAHLAVLARVAELAGEATELPAFFGRASEALRPVAGHAGLAVFVLDEAAGELVRVHSEGGSPALVASTERLPAASPLGDVVRERAARVWPLPLPGPVPAALEALPFGSVAWVPLVARSRGVGVLAAGFDGGVEAAAAAVDLLSAAAAHFASAVESHGLLGDLRRRVDELTLLVDVARASAQLDPVLLLEAALRRVSATVGADGAAAYLRDGERLLLLSSVGLDPECARALAQLGAGAGAPGEAIARRAPVRAEGAAAFGGAPLPGGCFAGAVIAVPLLAKADAAGVLVLGRAARTPYSDGDAALLGSIGAQLGVAVDAARLFSDVRRRLSDLEAVHALTLRVFANAPGDAGALLQDACRELTGALSARAAAVFLTTPGSPTLRLAASVGLPAGASGLSLDPGLDALSAEVMRTRQPHQSEDMTRDPRSQLFGREDVPPLAVLALPLVARRHVRGVVYVGDRAGRRFGPAEVAVANALAGALGIGVENAELYADARRQVEELSALAHENARLYDETRQRAEQLGLLHEVGRSLVATLDIEQILSAGVRSLARIVDAAHAYLVLATDGGEAVELRAATGCAPAPLGTRLAVSPGEPLLAPLVYRLREPVLVDDAGRDPRVGEEVRRTPAARALLGLPLIVRDQVIGAAVIVDTRGPRVFTPAEAERAAAVANQLAVAADNARLYEDLRRSYAQLARAQQRLVQGERLAALGELAAIVAHEVRNPLGVIFNSLGSLRRLVRPVGDARMLFDIVEEESERLNRIVGDLLDFARPSTPEPQPELLGRVVEDAVGAAVVPQGQRVQVVRELDPALPPVPMDARLVRQAVLNVAVNAVQAMPRGGRITVRTLRDGDRAVVEIEDSGEGIPDEVRERIFEPFFTTKASGTGLGLAVVRRIVEGHGGEVRVRSVPGAGTTFALRFPFHPGPVENDPVMR